MYSCIKLNLYCENLCQISQDIKDIFISYGLPFKELRSSTSLFSAIKNHDSIIVIIVSSKSLIMQLEAFVKNCHNYQNRIFIVFTDNSLDDKFFTNSCHHTQTDVFCEFLKSSVIHNISNPVQPSKLLVKLVKSELEKLQISTKYIGFNYLTQLAVNYLCNTYSQKTYIELFEYVTSLNLASIDTIERDVRHMLLTTWKTNDHFRQEIQQYTALEKPNSKNILNAVLLYLKSTI